MTDELRKSILVNIGTVRTLTLEVYEERAQTFTIDDVDYQLRDNNGAVVASGAGTYNNADTDEAGRTIKTVAAQIDFSESWAEIDTFRLHFFVTATSAEGGDSDVVCAIVNVVEYRK